MKSDFFAGRLDRIGLSHVVALAIAMSACSNQDAGSDRDSATTRASPPTTITQTASDHHPSPVLWDSIVAASPSMEACETARHVAASLDSIRRWPLAVTRREDEGCVFTLVDSIAAGFIRTGDTGFVEALDSMYGYSDGIIGEYFWDVPAKLLAARPGEFLRYLRVRQKQPSAMEENLLRMWRMDNASSADDGVVGEEQLKVLRRTLPVESLETSEKDYLESLLRKLQVKEI